jgi:multidrug efflux pump subunit AcrA (membrane-fusion protein)
MIRNLLGLAIAAAVLGLAGWGGSKLYSDLEDRSGSTVPVTAVKRGDVVFMVTAQGALQGGNSKVLIAPMTGSRELILTMLRKPGEAVAKDEVVAEFDTTEESYRLREAEAEAAEAALLVEQSQNEAKAREEELRYELIKARADLRVAELECGRNELLAALAARQNEIAREAAREKLEKLEKDYDSRRAAAAASIAIQIAAKNKEEMQAKSARRNIEMMTLRAPIAGYVHVERNQNSNFFYQGMQLPLLQVGDAVRPGLGVVQIPDLSSWEVTAQIGEEDRGHIAMGQPAEVGVVALPGKTYTATVSSLGGTTGPPWNRRFECKLALQGATPDLRPGMTARVVIRTHVEKNVLWVPAQALFERDGKRFVYINGAGGFTTKDVDLVRRSESQVVIKGLQEGELVAMASPIGQGEKKQQEGGGALKAISK